MSGDVAAIGAVVDEAYALLAFPPGGAPRWTRFAALFADGALLALRVFPADERISLLTLEAYAEAQMAHGLGEQGYSETPGERVVEVSGAVAWVRQRFTMDFAGRPPVAATDLFSLARLGGGWRIVSVVSDVEGAAGTG